MEDIGPFRVLRVLGQGGMGRVVLAEAPDGRLVAVKQVHAALAADEGFRARFRREVEASRKVSGAHTAAVVDADPEAATPWLASEYVPGPALGEALSDDGPMDEEAVRRLAVGLAHALAEIHGARLIHRDLKPSNVLLAEDGVRVIDFGIVRAVGDQTRITHTGVLVGSPAYMSPEQILGRELTPASDVFSLGATLVTAATGKPPFGGDSVPKVLHDVVYEEPDLDGVPSGLRGPIASCLAKEPADRPTPRDLLALLAGAAASVVPVPPVPTAPPAPPRGRRTLLVAAVVAAVLVATTGLTAAGRHLVWSAYTAVVPDTVPTPGNTPLSLVGDAYAGPLPALCADFAGKVAVPAGYELFGKSGRYEKTAADGTVHPQIFCFWNGADGDRIQVYWDLFGTRPGGVSGAEQAKRYYEEFYVRGTTKRATKLGFAEEGMWRGPGRSQQGCLLYARDVNLTLSVSVESGRYPAGQCESVAKAAARTALPLVAAR
ncbi:serine/threonine-protein kinase [Streptomyces sp. NPDC087917]|uniref:serine/threonine-protein kinase n=1 Tax=Streptomyces sp. NPDC087917 TaxID=3155060 RepID=UPI0034126582